MKRRTSFLLISAMALALVGCGNESTDTVSVSVEASTAEVMAATKEATTPNDISSVEASVEPVSKANSEEACFEIQVS